MDVLRDRARRASIVAFVATLTVLGLTLGGLTPAGADQALTTAGPLTNIGISSDLNCSVNHSGDTAGEFYSGTACATEISVGGTTYGPASIPAGNSPGGFTPVSQSAVTGTGTNVDPYTIVTVVDVGTTGLRITETDTYVVGQESYRTDVRVANTTVAPIAAILYRGADCFLQDSDSGFGAIGSPAGAVACVAPDSSNPLVPGTRIEQWLPITGGSNYYESTFSNIWSAMSAGTAFPDTCDCAFNEDNGAGLSWTITVPAGSSVTESHLTTFSPLGSVPLTMTKTADQGSVSAGAQDGYTITVSNPNASSVSLSTITDTLPAGFSYVAGSTTGATTADPGVSSQTLTWSGPLTVSGASGATPGTLSLHFNATVSLTPGTYMNDAAATSSSFTIVPTGDTAPVIVGSTTTATLLTSIAGTPNPVTAGADVQYTVTTQNNGPSPVAGVQIVDTLPSGASLVSATASGGCTGTTTVTCSVGTIAASGAASATLVVKAPGVVPVSGKITDTATATPGTNNTASLDTNVVSPSPGSTSGFVPPGGALSTGGNNPATLSLPNVGPGATVTLTQATGNFCGGPCVGPATGVNNFDGYTNPHFPISLTLGYAEPSLARSLADFLRSTVYKQPDTQTVGVKIADCLDNPAWTTAQKRAAALRRALRLGTRSGIANPAPCIDARNIVALPHNQWQVTFTILYLSGDPHFARR